MATIKFFSKIEIILTEIIVRFREPRCATPSMELLSLNRKALTKPCQLELFGKFATCKFNQMAVLADLKLSHEAEKILEVFQNAYKLLILQKTMTGYNP